MKPPCCAGRVRGARCEVGLRGPQRAAGGGQRAAGSGQRAAGPAASHALREDRGAYTTCNSSPFKYSPSGNAASSG